MNREINRINGAKNQRISRHNKEAIELNMLINYIKTSELSNIQSINNTIHRRLSNLQIAISSNSHKAWTTTELKWLRDNYKSCTARELAIDLKRSVESVKRTINKYGIKK